MSPTLLVSLIARWPDFIALLSFALTAFPFTFAVRLSFTTTVASTLSDSFSLVARGFSSDPTTWIVFLVSFTPDRSAWGAGVARRGRGR